MKFCASCNNTETLEAAFSSLSLSSVPFLNPILTSTTTDSTTATTSTTGVVAVVAVLVSSSVNVEVSEALVEAIDGAVLLVV